MRWVLAWVVQRLYAARTTDPPGSGPIQRLLLVRVDERVGNLIMLQPMLDALRVQMPSATIGLLTCARYPAIVRSLVGVDQLYELDKRWFLSRPTRWHQTMQAVRAAGYQVCIDVAAWQEFSFTHAALSYFSGSPVRIGYDRREDAGFHTVRVPPGPPDEYELRQRMRLLAPLGVTVDPPRLRSDLGSDTAPYWRDWLHTAGARLTRIGLWPGSRKHANRWPVGFFSALGRRLLARPDRSLVVLWGPGEEALRDQLVSAGDMLAAPPTDMPALAGLLRNLDVVVTNDTGPMHVAVAVGAPTVAAFVAGDAHRWGHPYPNVRNLTLTGSDEREPEQVALACEELLGTVGNVLDKTRR
jgi:heptosyltransferase-3